MTESTNDSSNQKQVNTSGGTYIEGDVEANSFVGRDLNSKKSATKRGVVAEQISGSVVVTGDDNQVTIHHLDPAYARNRRNHKAMRQLVRSFWIDGVLRHSLYREVLIQLNLEEHSSAVDNRPWDLILQQTEQPEFTLPISTPIIDVFDQMNQRLLILGEPGSGKTTMLLELAGALLARAEIDPTHPTPVVFNLSSWAEKRQPIAEWLIDELRTKYNIPNKVAQQWVDNDELIPLLDGLDEVQQQQRNACVAEVNHFREEHLTPLVVCSRVTEYKSLTTQLKLQGAVIIQPLTLNQIDDYLNIGGAELSAIRLMLKTDRELQDLASSPLILSIIVLAYKEAIKYLSLGDLEKRRYHLFDAYIYRGDPPPN